MSKLTAHLMVTLSLTVTTEKAKEILELVEGEEVVETKPSKKKSSKPVHEEEDEELEEEEDEAPKKKSSKKSSKHVEEDEDEELEEDEENEEDDEEEEAPKKSSKGSKSAISEEQIIAAFRDYAKKHDKEKAIKVLKSFGVKNVKDLKPSQYSEVMSKLKGK